MFRTVSASVVMSDPVHVAFAALSTNVDIPTGLYGRCLRCGFETDLIAARQVVSQRFSDWDRQQITVMADGGDVGWCSMCTWAYRGDGNRTDCTWITETGAERIAVSDLTSRLHRRSPSSVAVVLPVAKRKHLLPHSAWGYVSTDMGLIPWGDEDAAMLVMLCRMREAGVTGGDFAGNAPPFRVVTNPEHVWVMEEWDALVGYRNTVGWPVALQCARAWTCKETR